MVGAPLSKEAIMRRTPGTKIGTAAALAVAMAAAGCGETPGASDVEAETSAATTSVIKHVFVIAMENHDASQIYGNTTDAPYINNTLIPTYAHATNFK